VTAVALLVAAVAVMLVRPAGVPVWAGPVAGAAVGLAIGAISWDAASDAADLLAPPLAFLALAVPLAVLLDRIGVFAALAALVDGGRHLVAWLWVLAAAVTRC
jgi:arsenical pump membrane protein